jgi:hypothetical protein
MELLERREKRDESCERYSAEASGMLVLSRMAYGTPIHYSKHACKF